MEAPTRSRRAPTSSERPQPPSATVSVAAGAAVPDAARSPNQRGGEGVLDSDVVVSTIRSRLREVQRCYEAAIVDLPDLSGRVDVEFDIQPGGAVSDARWAASSRLQPASPLDPYFASCLISLIRATPFTPGPVGGSVRFSFPFVFAPRDDAPPQTRWIRWGPEPIGIIPRDERARNIHVAIARAEPALARCRVPPSSTEVVDLVIDVHVSISGELINVLVIHNDSGDLGLANCTRDALLAVLRRTELPPGPADVHLPFRVRYRTLETR